MRDMIYAPEKGEKIFFDDWVDDTESQYTIWVGICPQCLKRHREILSRNAPSGAIGICSVKGCTNIAEHYLDFLIDEVYFK